MNSINNIKNNSDSPSVNRDLADKNLELEKKGDDVKGAFLALLQGLVGFAGGNITQSAPIEAKAASYEQKEKTEPLQNSSEKANIDNSTKNQRNSEGAPTSKITYSTKKDEPTQVAPTDDKIQVSQNVESDKPSEEVVPEKTAPTQVVNASSEKDSKSEKTTKNVSEVIAKDSNLVSQNQDSSTSHSENEVTSQNQVPLELKTKVVKDSSKNDLIEVVSEENPAKVSPNVRNEAQSNVLDNRLNQDSNKDAINASEDVKVVSKIAEVKENSVGKEVLEGNDQIDESFDELRKYLSNSLNSTNTPVESPKLNKPVAESSDKMNSVKDALLARLLLGVEQSSLGSSHAQLTSGSKTDFQVISALGLRESSSEKLGAEKTQASTFKKEVKAQEFIDKIKEILAKAAANKTNDSISIKVNPEHLGEIKVTVSHKGNEIYAKLVPESKEIEHILKTKSHELNAVIQALGFTPDQVHVQVGSEPSTNLSWANFFRGNQENASKNGNSKEGRNSFSKQVDVAELIGGSVAEPKIVQDSGWVA